jgi:hypothetical protein
MDCKELFSIFEKIGGTFICNYTDNTGTLLPQNIKCKNLNNTKEELDQFIFGLSMYPNLFTGKKLLLSDTKVKKIHHYQDMSLKELSIKFCYNEGYVVYWKS